MTVEELKAQLEGTLQTVKQYIDTKDAQLNAAIQNNTQAIEAIGLDEDQLANLQALLENIDTDTLDLITSNAQKVGNFEQAFGAIQSYAQQLFVVA